MLACVLCRAALLLALQQRAAVHQPTTTAPHPTPPPSEGYVACLHQEDVPLLSAALSAPTPTLEHATLFPR